MTSCQSLLFAHTRKAGAWPLAPPTQRDSQSCLTMRRLRGPFHWLKLGPPEISRRHGAAPHTQVATTTQGQCPQKKRKPTVQRDMLEMAEQEPSRDGYRPRSGAPQGGIKAYGSVVVCCAGRSWWRNGPLLPLPVTWRSAPGASRRVVRRHLNKPLKALAKQAATWRVGGSAGLVAAGHALFQNAEPGDALGTPVGRLMEGHPSVADSRPVEMGDPGSSPGRRFRNQPSVRVSGGPLNKPDQA